MVRLWGSVQQQPDTKPSTSLSPTFYELIDSPELAKRLNLPESWVREYTRARVRDPIPHVRFGRYVRFEWPSPELAEWIAKHRRAGKVRA